MCENYFAQLKRGLKGTHIHVDPKHLHRYVNEFDYRYSHDGFDDTERMADLATRVAGRLTYEAKLLANSFGLSAVQFFVRASFDKRLRDLFGVIAVKGETLVQIRLWSSFP